MHSKGKQWILVRKLVNNLTTVTRTHATVIGYRVVTYICIYLVRILLIFLTLETIDILCLVYSNFCANEIIFKVVNDCYQTLNTIPFAEKFQ